MSWIALGVALTAVAVIGSLTNPQVLLVFPALVAFLFMLRSDTRLILFAAGVLFVFQSTDGISAPKVGFFLLVALITVVATVRSLKHLRQPWARHLKLPLLGSALLGFLTAVASVVGLSHGASGAFVLRDGITYLLIACAVPIAIDAGERTSIQFSKTVVVLVTAVAGFSFMVAFLSARGVSNIAITRLGLPTVMALSVGVSMSMVLALSGRRTQWRWLAFAAILVSFVLATGSRGGLVLLAASAGVVGLALTGRVRIYKLVLGAAGVVAAIVALLFFAASTVTSSAFLQTRIQASLNVLNNGSSQDASGSIRRLAAVYAKEAFAETPLLGSGFGHVYPNPSPEGGTVLFQIDTPFVLLAKFGYLGVILLTAALIIALFPAFRRWGDPRLRIAQSTALGASFVWIAQLYFGAPTEDKGFSLAVLLALTLLTSSFRESHTPDSPEDREQIEDNPRVSTSGPAVMRR